MNISDTGKPSIRLAFQQVPISWQILNFITFLLFMLYLATEIFWFVTITLSSDSEKKKPSYTVN